MDKKCFLFLALLVIFSLKVTSQTFTYRTSLKEMCGDPGEIFACSISFTNTSGSPINIHVDRYQKTEPAYWYSCFCYLQCHSPLRDTITINIPAFSTDILVVQFKTDSVNPGISTSDFKIYQVGFQSNFGSLHLIANTGCTIQGLNDFDKNANSIKLFPNPTVDFLNVSMSDESIKEIVIYDIMGQLKEKITSDFSKIQILNVKNYENGIYFMELYTDNNRYKKRFIKE